MYQPLECFSKNWIFKRNDPKVEPEDFQEIRLLSEQRAAQIWRDYISDEQVHPDHFTDKDWLKKTTDKAPITKLNGKNHGTVIRRRYQMVSWHILMLGVMTPLCFFAVTTS